MEPEQKLKQENTAAGTLGALLGAFAGLVCIILTGRLNFLASVSGLVMAVCTLRGYEKPAGTLGKKGAAISCAVILFMTYLAYHLHTAIELTETLGMSFPDAFVSVPRLLRLDILDGAVFWGNLVLLYLFAVLGAVPIVRSCMVPAAAQNPAAEGAQNALPPKLLPFHWGKRCIVAGLVLAFCLLGGTADLRGAPYEMQDEPDAHSFAAPSVPAEEPGAEEPGAREPGAEDPGAEEPGAEEPGAREPGAEDPGAEEPGAEEPGVPPNRIEITQENYRSLFHLDQEDGFRYLAMGFLPVPAEAFGENIFVPVYVPWCGAPAYSEDGCTLTAAAHGIQVDITVTPTDGGARDVVEAMYGAFAASGADIYEDRVSETEYSEQYGIAVKQAVYFDENDALPRICLFYADAPTNGHCYSARITYLPEQQDEESPALLRELGVAFGLSLPEIGPYQA